MSGRNQSQSPAGFRPSSFGDRWRHQLEEALACDYDDEYDVDRSSSEEADFEDEGLTPQHALIGSYRRPSMIATGPRSAVLQTQLLSDNLYLSKEERARVMEDERSLLRDNQVIPPKHPKRRGSDNFSARLKRTISLPGLRKAKTSPDEEMSVSTIDNIISPDETTTLLGHHPSLPYGGEDSPHNISKCWEEAVTAGKIQTTWRREAKVLAKYSAPLILTFILQYSLIMATVFTVGHIGKAELGAVSLGSMTANITGYAVYQGLATSLDTLCAQAYGSGRKTLVGLQLQRMVYFLWIVTIPIGIVWLSGTAILSAIVPEKRTAELAGLYLKIILLGAPGYAAFESGKRYVQAQGLFSANLYVLLICAPLNAIMNYIFVWKFGWGFAGAPIAVAITDNLLPVVLFAYVYLFRGRECWGGFSRKALKNWWPMIRLALPGLIMVLAEFLAFEILTLAASWIGSTHLAAQSVLSTITAMTYQIPFPLSIAASTRIANMIGATLADPAKVAARVALFASVIVGIVNITLLSSLRVYIPRLFTEDEGVIAVVAEVLPLCAAFQLFDALAATCNGILRGLGRQEIGGIVNLVAYYIVSST
jgi:MATE family multidrug resistance protein